MRRWRRRGKETVVEVWEGDGSGGVGRRWWWSVGRRRWWRRGKETVAEAWEGDGGSMLVVKKIE